MFIQKEAAHTEGIIADIHDALAPYQSATGWNVSLYNRGTANEYLVITPPNALPQWATVLGRPNDGFRIRFDRHPDPQMYSYHIFPATMLDGNDGDIGPIIPYKFPYAIGPGPHDWYTLRFAVSNTHLIMHYTAEDWSGRPTGGMFWVGLYENAWMGEVLGDLYDVGIVCEAKSTNSDPDAGGGRSGVVYGGKLFEEQNGVAHRPTWPIVQTLATEGIITTPAGGWCLLPLMVGSKDTGSYHGRLLDAYQVMILEDSTFTGTTFQYGGKTYVIFSGSDVGNYGRDFCYAFAI